MPQQSLSYLIGKRDKITMHTENGQASARATISPIGIVRPDSDEII